MGDGEAWRAGDVARRFARERASIVPESRTQIDVLLHVLRHAPRPIRRVVDLGCGDGVLLDAILSAWPDASGVALDYGDAMRDLAAARLAAHGARAVVRAGDLRTGAWGDALDGPVDVVVSGFAIHHLPDERKRALYAEIRAALAPGGIFLNLEHVASASPRVEALFDEGVIAHRAAACAAAGERVDVAAIRAAHHARPDKPDNVLASVERQCAWLREAGFVDVDVFWKWFELALFGGITPCS